ncbi:MAG: hypothetical protein ABEJ70_08350 [Halobacteriaceae archaeon]
MGDAPQRTERAPSTDEGDLRTVAFRMREIQRLLSMRVEQENRRLEAEGLEPVTRPRFLPDADAGDRDVGE